MGHHRVLLIDDEEEFTTTMAERLELRGMKTDIASSGQAALERVEGHDYDAVLLDLAMPGWDGIETLKRLKTARPELQIILLTGQATVGKGVEAIKLGAMDLVEKPADFKEVVAKIEEASAEKALLVESKLEKDLNDILRKKGW